MLSRCLFILLISMTAGLLFNLIAPQGIGFLPEGVGKPAWQPIAIDQARKLWEEKAAFVDAREPGEYQRSQIRGAINLYPSEWKLLYPLLKEFLHGKKVIVVYGKSFSRFPAANIAQRLKANGHDDVVVIETTFDDLKRAGLPVRQVRRGKAS